MTAAIKLSISERHEQLIEFVGAQLCPDDWTALAESIAGEFGINRNKAVKLVNECRDENRGWL